MKWAAIYVYETRIEAVKHHGATPHYIMGWPRLELDPDEVQFTIDALLAFAESSGVSPEHEQRARQTARHWQIVLDDQPARTRR